MLLERPAQLGAWGAASDFFRTVAGALLSRPFKVCSMVVGVPCSALFAPCLLGGHTPVACLHRHAFQPCWHASSPPDLC